jgi:hypothetical protein
VVSHSRAERRSADGQNGVRHAPSRDERTGSE